MSLPEISRRCLSCGAAVRAGARFCPQCGVLMGTEAAQAAGEARARPEAARAGVDGEVGQQARTAPGARESAESRAPERPAESRARPEPGLRRTAESVAAEPLEAEASRQWTPPKREFSAFVQSLESGEPQVAAERRDAARPPAGPGTEAAGSLAPGQTGVEAGDEPRLAGDAPHGAGDAPRVAGDVPRVAGVAPQIADNPQVADARHVAAARPRVTGEVPGMAATSTDSAEDMRSRVARVREGTRARVGKMREEALVVLEETPDDSGLRFVIAAAALFLVFLFLLFLSTTVLR